LSANPVDQIKSSRESPKVIGRQIQFMTTTRMGSGDPKLAIDQVTKRKPTTIAQERQPLLPLLDLCLYHSSTSALSAAGISASLVDPVSVSATFIAISVAKSLA
jgi:hypothetical protein